ncbi:MAG TPA: methylenetetrahydrofolate--tRNA-(uracil(54)-C(5))-methyltransferase (FADH(2)-oxidizing) TrmFO [Anaerolineaceae bacterium]|nr:methylenetetrahydrofolate--tRNA-(uracil(54)-C(5))-methyltransferase (FADH(2)-oxidizing) TrmFO [Anaerolineaceae bacterium]
MDLTIVGGGLAGAEAAWQAAQSGISVNLFEMRPLVQTGAHLTDSLAEIVCSNSFGSTLPDRAPGMLKSELELLGSLLLECARASSVPAGGALAVDRTVFSTLVTQRICNHPKIKLIRQEVTEIPLEPTIIASGPLTSPGLSLAIRNLTGSKHLFFFDAIAPILEASSIDMTIAYRASRYGLGEQADGDYINCPLDEEQYLRFVNELRSAERISLRDFENEIDQGVVAGAHPFFEGCLPVEVIAQRGLEALAFGPMRPIGLRKVHPGRRIYAVVQLRQDNLAASLYNMVGFQTNLTYPEQKRVFRLIPGLEKAEFARYGQMHRNTFIASPILLDATLQFKNRVDLFFAGQITGVEGYMGNIATGLLAGINAARQLNGKELIRLPPTSMLGALCHYITHSDLKDFQPMKSNFGILPPLVDAPRVRKDRNILYVKRGSADLKTYLDGIHFTSNKVPA